ncbi:unnamed protein product, partial [Mesorhabditis belari]|uniref:Protein kinase domain-containing protein n=1 Tax=Mesorhabditis belari TaxID=2138241 RepID=A0AAF3EH64_9BILA
MEFLLFFLFFHQFVAQSLRLSDGDNGRIEEDGSFRYIQKQEGESLSLICPQGANWTIPFTESPQRRTTKQTTEGFVLNISNLQSADTGAYKCAGQKIYLYVKGPKLFLKIEKSELPFSFGDFYAANSVPCRTTSFVKRHNMKLFVNDVQWAAWCNDEKTDLGEPIGSLHEPLTNRNCIPLEYSSTKGFSFWKMDFKVRWGQVNRKKFRCEFNGEKSQEFTVQAFEYFNLGNQQWTNFTPVPCTLPTKQDLLFEKANRKLKLSCSNCNTPEDTRVIEELIQRLHQPNELRNAAERSLLQGYGADFCNWIKKVESKDDPVSPMKLVENASTPTLKTSQLQWTDNLLSIGLLFLTIVLLILIVVGYAIWRREIRRKLLEEERNRATSEVGSLLKDNTQTTLIEQEIKQKPTFVRRLIDSGGFGKIYELIGHEPPAIVKCMHTRNYHPATFQKEFECLNRLEHPNVVKLLRMETGNEGKLEIVMEYCQRGNLGTLLQNPTIIYTMNTVISWAESLFAALGYMYKDEKFVHRDIKPENIFVTMDFRVKFGDFGLAKKIEETCTGTVQGTQRYMSPSQGERVNEFHDSHRNDVYSLGLVLWEMIERRFVNLSTN